MNEKKENAQNTEHYLRRAHENLSEAERYSKGTGDKNLIQKVTKLRQDVKETREDLNKKMDNHSG